MTERLLLVAPTARDAELSQTILANAGLSPHVCADLPELCREIAGEGQGEIGAVLLTDATLSHGARERLAAALNGQPRWSDIPVILLSPLGADSPAAVWAMNALSNVTVLDQPVRVMTLVSALRTAVRARMRQYELRDRLEALRQSDQQKDEFLATLSHELRNPLAPVRNALHVLRLGGADEGTRTRVVDTMERQVGNLIRLVDDLLELSRIKRGRIELRKQRVNMTDVLRGAVELSTPLLDAAGVELHVSEPPEALLLDADPVRITQVLGNLLNNAAKYTPRGGTAWLSARQEGSDAVISVRDTGIGISANMIGRVFDLFVQADPQDDRAKQGLGIGLTLVRRLVELHGGQVEATSAGPGQGSEFIVRLPTFADQRKPQREARPAGGGQDRRKSDRAVRRVLVVDDHEDSADSLGTLLRLFGHEVRVAYDGTAGLAAAIEFQPDVALLDLVMPGMSGIELAGKIRQQPGLEDMLLVALTGYGRDEDRRRSRDAGFDTHLVKPVDMSALNVVLASRGGPVPDAPATLTDTL